jgi:hypothetical protein
MTCYALHLYIVHFHVINFRPQFVLGVLLLSAVYGQESTGDVKLEMGKLAESIRGSALLKQGLTGTVAPSIGKKFEQLKLPSEDQVNEFIKIEAVNFQKTEIQNKELSSKNTVLIYLNYFLYWKNK